MADNKVNMPMSTAGLTRYFDDYKSKIQFKPGYIVIFTILIIILVMILHLFGSSISA